MIRLITNTDELRDDELITGRSIDADGRTVAMTVTSLDELRASLQGIFPQGLAKLDRLRLADLGGDLEWLLPVGNLDGADQAYGLPVRHVPGITAPYLAHRFPLPTGEPT